MSDLPNPLVPNEIDLRDFQFMPLDVRRLLTSETWINAVDDPRIGHAAMSLWCESWHQTPAGSLPDNDKVLYRLSMCPSIKEWQRVRESVRRGWVKCSDGRLYHRTVTEKARESWQKKLDQRERTRKATQERERRKQEREEAERRVRHDERNVQRDFQRNVDRDDSRDDERGHNLDVHQGTGTGTGTVKGQGDLLKPEHLLSGSASPAPDRALQVHINGYRAKALEVLEYLNKITGSHFRPAKSSLAQIEARLREGYSVERLMEIALLKADQWGKDEKMAEFLRPKTLYNSTNCANYDGTLPNGVDHVAA